MPDTKFDMHKLFPQEHQYVFTVGNPSIKGGLLLEIFPKSGASEFSDKKKGLVKSGLF